MALRTGTVTIPFKTRYAAEPRAGPGLTPGAEPSDIENCNGNNGKQPQHLNGRLQMKSLPTGALIDVWRGGGYRFRQQVSEGRPGVVRGHQWGWGYQFTDRSSLGAGWAGDTRVGWV
eukprot:767178-Hanusia_phi.AAC.1